MVLVFGWCWCVYSALTIDISVYMCMYVRTNVRVFDGSLSNYDACTVVRVAQCQCVVLCIVCTSNLYASSECVTTAAAAFTL